jgi:hypothetical protein
MLMVGKEEHLSVPCDFAENLESCCRSPIIVVDEQIVC